MRRHFHGIRIVARNRIRATPGFEAEQSFYSILRKLVSGEEFTEEDINVAHAIVCEEYAKQYLNKKTGYFALLKEWPLKDFEKFLRCIEWSISVETNDDLEAQALALVQACKFFSYRHEHLEKYILSTLLDELEKRSGKKGVSDRLLGTDGLKIIFAEILVGTIADERPIDPAAEQWESITTGDFRNVADKILAVSPHFSPSMLQKLARKCTLARTVEPAAERELRALRRRVLDICEDELEKQDLKSQMSQAEVIEIIDNLTAASQKHLATLAKSYQYRQRDYNSLKGTVLALFDDCFLAFDEVQDE
ncbi:hypothetical protein [Variovorax rhizosphaerae]|uniref:DUF4297 domain-containing protein n=1 Tax=Variovorax rhizosphaerae TaxID=1836200 RepID=A0ABU8WLX7_9BURK